MQEGRLYYADAHLRELTARVLECEPEGEHWRVVLDQTAFYPEGGGQAGDRGLLNQVRVLDTREAAETVIHLCDSPLEVGTVVTGKLDWEHRFDLMQQHTGEHMVSGILHRLYGANNVGFHMGWESITIDFDVEIPGEDLPKIESMVNQAIWQCQPVRCWIPEPQELETVVYRSKRPLPWPVRIVQVGDTDCCACCGVHVKNTGEIGLVKLFSCVKFRSGSRIEMLCGQRALAYMNRIFQENARVSHAFSAKAVETGQAAEQMNETLSQYKYRLTGLENQLFAAMARDYQGKENALVFQPELDSAGVRRLAEQIARQLSGIAAVFSGEDGEGYRYALMGQPEQVGELCKAMHARLSGRGGGRGGLCQGSVPANQAQIRDFFAEKH